VRLPPSALAAFTALAAIVASTGCASPTTGDLQGLEVDRAWVENARIHSLSILLGSVQGTGEIHVEGEGVEVTAPIQLNGGTVGISIDFSSEVPVGSFDLELPDGQVLGQELLGTYEGSAEAVVAIAGVEVRHLSNEHGVTIDQAFFSMGISMSAAYAWLRLLPSEAPVEEGDTG
jgi:hypothetical protein